MNRQPADKAFSASAMREAFDRSFADAPAADADISAHEDHLLIGLNEQAHALPLRGLTGLQALDWVTPVASTWPACLGIMSHKGAILPVYDLRLLLGCAATSKPRWVALTAQPAVALAFDRFDRLLRLPRHERFVFYTNAQGHECKYPVVDVPAMLDLIQKNARTRAMQQERCDVDIR